MSKNFLALICLTCITSALLAQDKLRIRDSLITKAKEYIKTNNYSALLKINDELLQVVPCNKLILNHAIYCSSKLADTAKLIYYYQEGLKCDNESTDNLIGLGYIALARKDIASAEQYFSRSYLLNPSGLYELIGYAHALWLAGKSDEAKGLYDKSLQFVFCKQDLNLQLKDLNFLVTVYPDKNIQGLLDELNAKLDSLLIKYEKQNNAQLDLLPKIEKSEPTEKIKLVNKIIQEEEFAVPRRFYLLAPLYDILGSSYEGIEEYSKAITCYQEAARLSESAGDKYSLVYRLTAIARIYEVLKRRDLSHIYYQQALGCVSTSSSRKLALDTYMSYAEYLHSGNDSFTNDSLSLTYYERALTLSQLQHDFTSTVKIYYREGNMHFETDPGKAEELYNKALDIALLYGQTENVLLIYHNLSSISSVKGDISNTLYFLKRGWELGAKYTEQNKKEVFLQYLTGFGYAYTCLHKYDSAILYLELARNKILQINPRQVASIQLSDLTNHSNVFDLLVQCYVETGDMNMAFKTMDQSKSAGLAEKMKLSLRGELSIAELQKRMKDDEVFLIFDDVNINLGMGSYVILAISKQKISSMILTDSILFTVASEHFYSKYLNNLIENMKKSNKTDRFYFGGMISKPLKVLIYKYITSLANSASKKRAFIIKKNTSNSDEDDTDWIGFSKMFYDILIHPFGKTLEGKRDLTIIGDGMLSLLPFESLLSSQDKYLGELYRINYLPSIAVGQHLPKPNLKNLSLLAIGDPVYSNKTFISDTTSAIRHFYNTHGFSWPALPGTKSEITNISIGLPTVERLRYDATETNFKKMNQTKELKKFSIIHFATHGINNMDNAEYSAIVLSQLEEELDNDGFLTIAEIEKIKIVADLVCLSGCQTASGEFKNIEGVASIANAFFVAGAKSVIGSHWNVSDNATSIFMSTMYRYVKDKHLDFKTAMLRTRLKFIKGSFGIEYQKPYYWSAFTYSGN